MSNGANRHTNVTQCCRLELIGIIHVYAVIWLHDHLSCVFVLSLSLSLLAAVRSVLFGSAFRSVDELQAIFNSNVSTNANLVRLAHGKWKTADRIIRYHRETSVTHQWYESTKNEVPFRHSGTAKIMCVWWEPWWWHKWKICNWLAPARADKSRAAKAERQRWRECGELTKQQ